MTVSAKSDLTQDPIWEEALDWHIRLQSNPDDAQLRSGLDHWMAEEPGRAIAYREAERIWGLTGAVRPEKAFRHLSPPSKQRRVGRVPMLVGAIAACLALFVFAGSPETYLADHRTGTGEFRTLELSDGSVVEMDAQTALDITLTDDAREISLLSGRAFFKVAPDRERPFTVSANNTITTVTGTSFSVGTGDEAVTVEVLSGRVSVDAAWGGDKEGHADLTKGKRVRVAATDKTMDTDNLQLDQIAIWRSGRLAVRGATLAELADALGPYHHGVIIIPDEALRGRKVTGVFNMRDPLAVLRTVAELSDARMLEVSPYLVVLAKP